MLAALKSVFRPFVPAGLRRRLRFARHGSWLGGDYATWADARAASDGYDSPGEMERYLAAARAVEAGGAAWERDAAVFTAPAVHAPLLETLRTIARRQGGSLDVVDFGGGFGSVWRQHRAALADITVNWRVIDQPAWVAAGQREFANSILSFHASLADAARDPSRQVLLLSSVLQYLEAPCELLAEMLSRGFADVMVDRIPLWEKGRDRLAVQRTPAEFGGGSYPCWVFDRASLLAALQKNHRLVREWEGFDDLAVWARYRGFYFTRAEA